MGTNYTLRIGKRSSWPGSDSGSQFAWAIPPGVLTLLPANADVIDSESGDHCTVGEFLARVAGDDAAFDTIGTRFS